MVSFPLNCVFISYATNARIASDRYKDQLKTPIEIAVHWVKHVAKNRGAPHLRCAAVDLPLSIYYNLDVYFGLGVAICLLMAAVKMLVGGIRRIIIIRKHKVQ